MEACAVVRQLINALKREARRDSDGDLINPFTVHTLEAAELYLKYAETILHSGDTISITGDSMYNRSDLVPPSRTI